MSGDHEACELEKQGATLKNWEKWEAEWQKVQGKIAEKLEVNTKDLLLNYSDGLQTINKEKEVLEYTKIPTEFDKYRGKPDFYKLPNALPKKFTCCCCTVEGKICRCNIHLQKCVCCCKTGEAKCKCRYCSIEPTYFAVKSKPERYIVPSVELVGVPKCISQEKNILNETRNIYRRWQDSKYRQQQMYDLADKIKRIVPHWPEFDHLIVLGKRIVSEENKDRYGDEIDKEHYGDEIDKDSRHTVENSKNIVTQPSLVKCPRLALKVNGMLLCASCDNETRKIRMFFEYDISGQELGIDFLNFENVGSTTLRVSWKKIEMFHLFRDYVKEKWEVFGFYFDKRELVILPGHKITLPIWFKTETSGTMSESWELVTSPTMIKEPCQVILLLESYSYFKDLKEKVNLTLKYIDIQTRNLIIKDFLYDLLQGIKYTGEEIVPCVYGEAKLFEIANMINDRPLFAYNATFFNELKLIYNKLGEGKWDCSVKNLIKLAHYKDTQIYKENKITELTERIAKIESSQKELAKTMSKTTKGGKKKSKKDKRKIKKNKSSKSSKSSKKSKSSQKLKKGKKSKKSKSSKTSPHSITDHQEVKVEIEKEPYEYSTQLELWNVLRKFDTPVVINSEREKYFACFNVLTAYFDKMCHLLEEVDNEKGIIEESTYPQIKHKLIPMNELPTRLVYEYFEHHYIPRHPDGEIFRSVSKRKPKMLRDISSDDIETLYTTYFNKPIVKREGSKMKKIGKKKSKKKSSKTKTSKSSKSSKSAKSKKSSKSSKSAKSKKSKKSKKHKKSKGKMQYSKEKIVKKEISVESFNPYSEYFVYTSESEEINAPGSMEIERLASEISEDCHYKRYLAVYSCLSGAVDALVDTIHSFGCVVSHSNLQEVREQLSEYQD